jgi:uncharacterized protein with HEPN domain
MQRDPLILLDDMLLAIRKVRSYTKGMTKNELLEDERTLDAVIRNLEVLGEAAKYLPGDFRDQYRDIEWRKIAGLRDILIHQYFGIDIHIIWDILETKLPSLEKNLQRILEDLAD